MTEYDKYWVLSPIVGEVSNLSVVIICDPYYKSSPLLYSIEGFIGNDKTNPYVYEGTILSSEFGQETDINNNIRIGPTRIVLKFPQEGLYEIKWFSNIPIEKDNNIGEITQIFAHKIIVDNEPNKMIFVSCDFLEADTSIQNSMWTRMYSELEPILSNKHICLFHIGDQAYMDKVFKDSVRYAHENGYNDKTAQHIIQSFGQRYCDTWMPHNNVLSSVFNYNLWDDHELKNNMMLNDTTLSV